MIDPFASDPWDLLPVRWRWTDYAGQEQETSYLSPNQLWRFATCEECYRLEYIERQPKILKPALLVGGAVHQGIEARRRRWLDNAEGYNGDDSLCPGGDPLERLDDDVTAGVEHLEHELDMHWQHARWEDAATGFEIIEWNRTVKGPDDAKDQVANILRGGIPQLVEPDHDWGLTEAEFRVWGIGQPLDAEEQLHYTEGGTSPLLPFGVMAYCDAEYRRGILSDSKTSHGHSQPSYDHAFQLATYDLPWWKHDRPNRLKLDQFSKAKNPRERYVWWWLTIDRSHVLQRYLRIAERIAACVRTGDWQARPNWWCSYRHELHFASRGDES